MKIGIVCYPTFGGSGVVATELGKALAHMGHQIHFITYNQPFRLEEFTKNIFYHEVKMYDYPLFDYKPYELVLTSKMVDVAKYEKLDLFHVHYAIPHASAAFMAREILSAQGLFVPYVTTLHGTDITLLGKEASYEPVITFAINESNAVTSVSESLKQDTYLNFNIQRDISVIHNFICPDHYKTKGAEVLRNLYAPNGERIVMHISNFRKVKRVLDVVHIFAGILKKTPAKLILIGDGPERSKAEALCRELGTCGHTSFLGKLIETNELLAIADLFLLPSESESFGLAALEAMASATPVISSNTGGLPELNEHGYSGYMAQVGAIQEMTDFATHILSDDATLDAFKQNALAQSKRFTIENILPQYIDQYSKVLSRDFVV